MSASTDIISPTNVLNVRGISRIPPNFSSAGTPTNMKSLTQDQHDTDESVIPLHRVYWERKYYFFSLCFPIATL